MHSCDQKLSATNRKVLCISSHETYRGSTVHAKDGESVQSFKNAEVKFWCKKRVLKWEMSFEEKSTTRLTTDMYMYNLSTHDSISMYIC